MNPNISKANIQTVTIKTQGTAAANLPFEGDFFVLKSATGNISMKIPGTPTSIDCPVQRVFKFKDQFYSGNLQFTSDAADDTLTFDVGFGIIIPTDDVQVTVIGGNIGGQYAEGTNILAPNNPLLFPVIAGMRARPGNQSATNLDRAVEGVLVNQKMFVAGLGTDTVVAPIFMIMPRWDAGSNLAIAAGASQSFFLDGDYTRCSVYFTTTNANILDVAVKFNGSPDLAPIVYDFTTEIPTAVQGQMPNVTTGYFFSVKGCSQVKFTGTGNADTVNAYIVFSRD